MQTHLVELRGKILDKPCSEAVVFMAELLQRNERAKEVTLAKGHME